MVSNLKGLRQIHAMGILHLDLKPSNVLITETGALQISDFGLSVMNGSVVRARSESSPREGDREYMSPETLHGDFGKPADVFRLVSSRI